MRAFILVFLGGGAGSALRWWTGAWALSAFGPRFPAGTFIVNAVGCFVMGLLFRLLPHAEASVHDSRLLLMTGVLGGFTTFSAFALDTAALWLRDEQGLALVYIALTFVTTLAGVALGLAVGRWVAA
jgi:CrcB protein